MPRNKMIEPHINIRFVRFVDMTVFLLHKNKRFKNLWILKNLYL